MNFFPVILAVCINYGVFPPPLQVTMDLWKLNLNKWLDVHHAFSGNSGDMSHDSPTFSYEVNVLKQHMGGAGWSHRDAAAQIRQLCIVSALLQPE
jgi:hypothetical protein